MSADPRSLIEHSLGAAYRFERTLEGGGMSKVCVVFDIDRQQDVVMKVLSPELSGSVDRERFKREIQVATQLHHPRIVPVLTTGVAGDALYYTMPLIDGPTLKQLIATERQLPRHRALQLARDAAEALEYAHGQNIVHRDVKPDNILVDRATGRALVTDFGIARAIDKAADIASVTSTGLTLGTPMYMSPEQASAEKHIDGRSDIYSLGCVLYELLTGMPPFTGPNARVVISRHLQDPPPSLRIIRPDASEQLESLMQQMLAKVPAARFQTVTALIAALDALIAAEQTPTPGSQPALVGQKPFRSSRLLGAAAAVVAAGVIAMLLFNRSKPQSPPASAGPDPRRIAVLYLDAPESDTALSTIARGLTREFIFALGQVPGLQLITENGVRRFGARAAPDSVARYLDAGTVITGSIDRMRDSLQLDLHLVDVRTSVDKATIRRRFAASMLLTMRDSAVHELSSKLLQFIGKEVQSYTWRSETQSADAWKFMQRARDLDERAADLPSKPSDFTPQLRLLVAAQSLLDSATRADPQWSEPVIARGWILLNRARMSPPDRAHMLIDSGLVTAHVAAARWPASAQVLELRATINVQRLGDGLETSVALVDSVEADARAATATDRQLVRAWLTLGRILDRKGDTAGSVVAMRSALEADAYGREVPRIISSLVVQYLFKHQNDTARIVCASARARFPTNAVLQPCELTVLGWVGSTRADVAAIWPALDRTEREGAYPLEGGMFPVGRYWVAAVLARAGMVDSARAVLANTTARLRGVQRDKSYAMNEAHVRLNLGERDAALALLDSAIQRDPAKRRAIAALPWFDELRQDPRFQRLIADTVKAR